jgi:hypothetical protein
MLRGILTIKSDVIFGSSIVIEKDNGHKSLSNNNITFNEKPKVKKLSYYNRRPKSSKKTERRAVLETD